MLFAQLINDAPPSCFPSPLIEISNRSYMCGHPGCGTTTSKWSDLRAHIQQQHPPTCPACSKTFKSRSNLKSHLKATAHDSTTLAQLEARGRRRRKRRNRRKVRGVGWESVEASTSAVDDEEADEEDGNDDDYGCGNPGGLGDTSSNYQSTFSPREAFLRQVFVCKMEGCGHSVATVSCVLGGVSLVILNMFFIPSLVPTQAYALRVHQRNKHENARPFPCKECGMAFGYKNVLHRHVRNIHHYPEGSGALDTLAVGGGVEVAGSCVYTSSIRNDQIDNLDDYIPTELVPNLDSTDACKDYTPPKKTQPEEEKSTTKPLPATPSTIITSSSGITPHLPYHTHTLENINLLADITGFKYDLYAEETGRTLSCPVDPIVCIQKFKREWDVYRHVCAIHPEYK